MKRVITVLLCIVFTSCSIDKTEKTIESLKIPNEQTKTANLKLDFHMDPPVFLDNSEMLLGRISDISIYNNEYFILTESKGNGLYVFNSDGEYLRKIGKAGPGPNEYRFIQSFQIKDNLIYALDREAQRIVIYSLNGDFIKTVVNKVYGFDLQIIEDNLIVYAGNSNLDNDGLGHKLLVYNMKGEFVDSFQDINERQAEFLNFIPQNVFSQKRNLYLEPFSNTIYRLKSGEISPWRFLDFGSNTLPEEELNKNYENVADFVTQIRETNYAIFYNNIRETNDYLSFSYELNDRRNPNLVLVNMNNFKTVIFKNLFENVVTNGLNLSFKEFKLVGDLDNNFIFIVYPYDLIDKGVSLNKDLKIDDNPIVFKLKLK